jgi:hypothetical protein
MKKILLSIITSLALFVPLFAHAGTFNFSSPNTIKITTETINTTTAKATISITAPNNKDIAGYMCILLTGTFRAYKDVGAGTDCATNATPLSIKKGTSKALLFPKLKPSTYYFMYLVYGTDTVEIYPFYTDPSLTTTGYGMTLSQNYQKQGAVTGQYSIPVTSTASYMIEIKKSDGTSVLTSSGNPVKETTTATTITYSFDLGDLASQIAPGTYTASLIDTNANNVTRYGPIPFNLTTTTIVHTKLTYKTSGSTITAEGRLDPSTHPDFRQFVITFDWGKEKDLSDNKGPSPKISNFSDDGSYSFTVQTDPSTSYYIRQTIVGTAGQQIQTTDLVNSSKGIVPTSGTDVQKYQDAHGYRLLAPLPGLTQIFDPGYCADYIKENGTLPSGVICDVNDFINYIMKLLIGLSAVLLVLRIMLEGYKLMTTDVPYVSVSAKSHITESALGLALALTAWIILNTINPQLVSNGISLKDVAAGIESFTISSDTSLTGQPVKINFNTEAYPAACVASNKTGVSASLILAIFDQETSSGAGGIKGTGRCTINNTRMYDADKAALPGIASELGIPLNTTPVSCALKNPDGSYNGYGGAIGYAQALPTTWNSYKTEAKANLSKTTLDPWKVNDALMFIGVFMKHHNGITSPYNGACDYFGRCSFGGVDYAAEVVSRKTTFETEIASKISAGTIKDCKDIVQ